MQKITLDINPKGEIPFLYFSQYDNGRLFQIELVDGEQAYNVPLEYSVQLNVRKTDSKLVTKAPVDITDNILTFATSEQMTACPGENIASVTLKDADDYVITTLYFLISVQRDVLAGGLDSASEIHNIEQQIAAIVPEVIGDDYYNKSETDALLANKANISDLANLASKAELEHAIDEEDTAIKNWAYTNFATPGYIANRYYNKTQVDELLFNMLPIGTASGNPCSFDTEIEAVLHALTAEIVASGGGGTPSNPIPIVGHTELNLTRCGVNLWDEEYIISSSKLKSKNVIPVEPNKTYRYINGAGIYASIDVVNANGTYISFIGNIQAGTTFTTPEDCHYLAFNVAVAYGTTYNNDITISDSSNTEYHAYEGQTFTVAFGQTVYGGVYDKSGRLTITWGVVDLGTLNFYGSNGQFYTLNLEGVIKKGSAGDYDHLKCSIFKAANVASLSNLNNYEMSVDTNGYLQIRADDYSTDAEFETAMSGIMLAYELATPIVIDVQAVSPSAVVGTNNIISDCNGDVNVSYKDSIQHYIDTRS